MRELVCTDEKLKNKGQLEAKLLEGLNSPENEIGVADWKDIRKEAISILESRKLRR